MRLEYVREGSEILPAVDYTKHELKNTRKKPRVDTKTRELQFEVAFWSLWGKTAAILIVLIILSLFAESLA